MDKGVNNFNSAGGLQSWREETLLVCTCMCTCACTPFCEFFSRRLHQVGPQNRGTFSLFVMCSLSPIPFPPWGPLPGPFSVQLLSFKSREDSGVLAATQTVHACTDSQEEMPRATWALHSDKGQFTPSDSSGVGTSLTNSEAPSSPWGESLPQALLNRVSTPPFPGCGGPPLCRGSS